MIEILLIVVIMLIASALAVPSFLKSYQSTKLRTSVRSIVMASRYARAMAVLQQKQVALLFDAAKNDIEVVTLESEAGAAERTEFLDERGQVSVEPEPDFEDEEDARTFAVASQLKRFMADDVSIVSVRSEKGAQEYDGIFWVNYYPNGMCDEYSVHLRDARNKSVIIEVDPMSGRAKVEYAR